MNHAPTAPCHRRAHLLAAAGLLHDVGKIGEPTGATLPPAIQRMEQQMCPSDARGGAQYRHVLYSAQLLHEAESRRVAFGGLDQEALFQAVAFHHQRTHDRLDECILKKADRLASGHDRRAGERDDAGRITGLLPILGSVQWPKSEKAARAASAQVPALPLTFGEDEFLPTQPQDRASYVAACRQIWQKCRLERSFWDATDCVDGLSAWLLRLASALPASRSWGEQADVSLYDHSRIVAALAACLAVQHTEGPCDPNQLHGRYRLVSLACGGIQNYLFRTVPVRESDADASPEKGMARRLRARSFHVSVLSWLAGRRLLQATGMPSVNQLLDAGGRSRLLFPDNDAVRARLQEAIGYVENWVASQFGGVLRFEVAISERLDDTAFSQDRFAATIRGADEGLRAARLRVPIGLRDAPGWREEGWVERRGGIPIDEDAMQSALEELGRRLPQAKYLSLDSDEEGLHAPVEVFGYRVRLHEAAPPTGRVFALALEHREDPTTGLFLAANHVPQASAADVGHLSQMGADERATNLPLEIGDLIPFEQLAELASDETGTFVGQPMLGVLKADVDRLGAILAYGLGKELVSFGRFAALERTLDFFFKGFLTQQLERQFPRIYTVYSGGDDLFLIGPWYDVVRLTERLHGWFGRLTSGNLNVTFSAGVVFAKATVPVRHLGHAADEALEHAKESGRNRISLGRYALGWDEFREALELHRLMRVLLKHRRRDGRPIVTGSLLYRLLNYAKMGMGPVGGEPAPATSLKWRAQLSYDLKRNLPAPKGEDVSPEDGKYLGDFHERVMAIRSGAKARILYTATSITLYWERGGGET